MNRSTKKLIPVFIAAVILVGGLIYGLFFAGHTETYTAPLSAVTAKESPLLAKDGDGDGLKDWEETLWKTDPANPDTDGDGGSDGSEIKLGRNPLIAGPNDKLDDETVSEKINPETEKDLTETDKFSRELFMKIVAAKKANQPPTEADLEKFLNATIEQELKTQPFKKFGPGDFRTDSAETPEKIKAYGNEIALILTKKPPQELEYEMDIFDRAQQNNDPEELKKLEPLIAQYQSIENALLKVVVPESALPQHAAFTESVAGMIYGITGLKYIMTDPIKAMPGVASYAENSEKFMTVARQFKSYFKTVGVSFEEGDRGYEFFDNI